jgi:membrane dipeptidase
VNSLLAARVLTVASLAPILLAAQAPARMRPLRGVSAEAMAIYQRAIVIDAHNDLPSRIADDRYNPDRLNLPGFSPDARRGHTDIPRLIRSGITGQFLASFVDAKYASMTPDSSYGRAVLEARIVHDFVRRHPRTLSFAATAAEIERAKREGKIAVLIGVEGGHAIENSLDKLRVLRDAGVRYMTLTWNNGNDWAGGNAGLGNTRTGGLTDLGRQVIREMNRLGIMVDISHVSDSTFWDAVRTSTKPVIASHSSARALSVHRRNMNDDMLRAVRDNGGVVNVNFYSAFIDSTYRKATAAIDPALRTLRDSMRAAGAPNARILAATRTRKAAMERALPVTPLRVLIDHIDHIATVAGVDHVGLGSDFDGVDALPAQMEDVTQLPRIAQGLLDRGYTAEQITKILGGNMLRVMRATIDDAGTDAQITQVRRP